MPEWGAHLRWESRASTASSIRMSTRMRESVRMRGSKSEEQKVRVVGMPHVPP